jgi:hypothetical protein
MTTLSLALKMKMELRDLMRRHDIVLVPHVLPLMPPIACCRGSCDHQRHRLT